MIFKEWKIRRSVDPDIYLSESRSGQPFNLKKDREFRDFFREGWLDSSFDDIRAQWDSLLNDPEPSARVYAKTALWSVVQYRRLNSPPTETGPIETDQSLKDGLNRGAFIGLTAGAIVVGALNAANILNHDVVGAMVSAYAVVASGCGGAVVGEAVVRVNLGHEQ